MSQEAAGFELHRQAISRRLPEEDRASLDVRPLRGWEDSALPLYALVPSYPGPAGFAAVLPDGRVVLAGEAEALPAILPLVFPTPSGADARRIAELGVLFGAWPSMVDCVLGARDLTGHEAELPRAALEPTWFETGEGAEVRFFAAFASRPDLYDCAISIRPAPGQVQMAKVA